MVYTPGGKKVLEAVEKSIFLPIEGLKHSYKILRDYGNMKLPTILFVLQSIFDELRNSTSKTANIFGAAFGAGLTMETRRCPLEPAGW